MITGLAAKAETEAVTVTIKKIPIKIFRGDCMTCPPAEYSFQAAAAKNTYPETDEVVKLIEV